MEKSSKNAERAIGRVTDVKAYIIRGELISKEKFEASPRVSLYANDLFVVTVPAANIALQSENEKGKFTLPFEFKIGDPLRKLIPNNARINVCFEEGAQNHFEIPNSISKFSFGAAKDGGAKLKEMLAGDYEITHWGYLAKTFSKNPKRKMEFLREYKIAQKVVEGTGKSLPFTGGNLLGLIRNNDFIPNDYDLDTGIYFFAESAEDAGEQYGAYLPKLIDSAKNFNVNVKAINPGQLFLNSSDTDESVYIDLLFGWYQPDGFWYRLTSFGGKLNVESFEYKTIDFLGKAVVIPKHAEAELVLTYGEDWHHPKPIYRPHRKEEVLEVLKRFRDTCVVGHSKFFK